MNPSSNYYNIEPMYTQKQVRMRSGLGVGELLQDLYHQRSEFETRQHILKAWMMSDVRSIIILNITCKNKEVLSVYTLAQRKSEQESQTLKHQALILLPDDYLHSVEFCISKALRAVKSKHLSCSLSLPWRYHFKVNLRDGKNVTETVN